MKDTRRLADRIAQLAGPDRLGKAGRDLVAGQGTDGALAAILREVDETVLPRRLDFRRGDSRLTVSAGNRRLISIDAAEGPGTENAVAILGRPLTQPDVALLGRLRDALSSSLGGSGPISVRTSPPSTRHADFAAGTTAAALASAWGVDLAPMRTEPVAPPASALESFLASAPTLARAWLRLSSGDVAETGGDRAIVSRLRDFADSADMADLDMQPAPDNRRFVAIGRAPDEGDCLLFVSDRMDSALMMIPAEHLDSVKKSWLEATR